MSTLSKPLSIVASATLFVALVSPIAANAKPHDFHLSSNVDGSEVKGVDASAKNSVLGQCVTPCSLSLKGEKLDYFVFSHPEYPATHIVIDEFRPALKKKGPIKLRGDFEKSFAQINAEREAEFQAQHAARTEAALNGPDANAVPLIRTPPIFPPRVENSGWCHMRFDVSASGHASNITPIKCSEDVFASPSVRSITKWRFIPSVKDGRFDDSSGEEILISYRMIADDGITIPPALSPPNVKQ